MKRFLSLIWALLFILCVPVNAYADEPAVTMRQSGSVNAQPPVAGEGEQAAAVPVISQPDTPACTSALLAEVTTGKVLYEHNADQQLYPASVTKIMTMLLVAEAIDSGKTALEDTVTASDNACSKGGSQIWLEQGETMTVRELLLATAVGSANDAATALGEHIAGSEAGFVDMMNERAHELGMTNTNFDNATGLDDTSQTHLSTARDIAVMSCELMKHSFIEEFTTVWMDSLRGGETQLVNTNKLVRFYPGTTGIKTGTTSKAGNCVSASARRDSLHLVAVIMGSSDSTVRFESAKALLNWGFSNYTMLTPAPQLNELEPVKVEYGELNAVTAVMGDTSPVLIEKSLKDSVTYEIEPLQSVQAPVEKGAPLGTIRLVCGGKTVASIELVSPVAIRKMTAGMAVKRLVEYMAGKRVWTVGGSEAE